MNEEKILKIWSRKVRLEIDRYHIEEYEPSYHILSFGGGRQTVALLLKMEKLFNNNPKAFVVFAEMTLKCLKENVPPEVPGIAFLSGGQSEIEATQNLNANGRM